MKDVHRMSPWIAVAITAFILLPYPAATQGQDHRHRARPVVIHIDLVKYITLNGTFVRERDLGGELESVFSTRTEKVLIVKGNPHVEYGDVARLIDIAMLVGPNNMKIGLMTPAMEHSNQDPCIISMLRAPIPHGDTILVDLFKATNPSEMSKAAAEAAVIVTITRSGEIYLSPGTTATALEKLPQQVNDLRAKATKENKNVVYVKADWRAEYRNVEELVDNLRAAGIEKIVLLTEGGGSNRPAPGGAYRVGGGVSAPVAIYKPNPEYTKEAIEAKFEGVVILFVVVDEKGTPRELEVIRPLGMGLDEKAIEAAQKWRFRPGKKDGHPVPVQMVIDFTFRLPKR